MLSGIPLHPLAVHFGVVLTLLASAAVLLAAVHPGFRRWLGWGLPLAGVVAAVAARVTQSFGEILMESSPEYDTAAVHRHAEWGERAGALGMALGLVSILLWLVTSETARQRWTARWPGWLRTLATVLAVLVPIAAVVVVTLAGHTGAQAVWSE